MEANYEKPLPEVKKTKYDFEVWWSGLIMISGVVMVLLGAWSALTANTELNTMIQGWIVFVLGYGLFKLTEVKAKLYGV